MGALGYGSADGTGRVMGRTKFGVCCGLARMAIGAPKKRRIALSLSGSHIILELGTCLRLIGSNGKLRVRGTIGIYF